MRQDIQQIKNKELETADNVSLQSAKIKGIQAPEVEIDDQF